MGTTRERMTAPEPKGELTSRMLAMPANANPNGHMFGGWIMSIMDAAAAMAATRHAEGRVVTTAVSDLNFLRPIHAGDAVCCYTQVVRVRGASMTLDVEVWVLPQGQGNRVLTANAEFTFAAIDDNGRPRRLARWHRERSCRESTLPDTDPRGLRIRDRHAC